MHDTSAVKRLVILSSSGENPPGFQGERKGTEAACRNQLREEKVLLIGLSGAGVFPINLSCFNESSDREKPCRKYSIK